jgi:hypothetical protein
MRAINDGLTNAQRSRLRHPNKDAEYRDRHRERVRKRARLWVRANRIKCSKYARRYYKENKEHCKKLASESRKRSLWKSNARQILKRAVLSGVVTRPIHCEVCGLICKPHGHHPDYSKPLKVIWVCTSCHGKEHRRMP